MAKRKSKATEEVKVTKLSKPKVAKKEENYYIVQNLKDQKINLTLVIGGKSESFNLRTKETLQLPKTEEVKRQLHNYIKQNFIKLN